MKIGVYFQLTRIGVPVGNREYRIEPTGVGTHIVQMIRGLSSHADVNLTAVLPTTDLDNSRNIPANFPMAGMPLAVLPYSRRTVETAWTFLNAPAVDRWVPDCDWIYCPQEVVVAARRASLAVTVHDTYYLEDEFPWKSPLQRIRGRARWKLLFATIRKRANLVLAVSEFTKSRLVKLCGYDPERIFVVGNPITDRYFEPPSPPPPDEPPAPQSPYLLVVGGLSKKKGGDYILSAAGPLAKSPDIKILVCGGNDPVYKNRAANLPNINFLGYVPAERYLRLLKNARALLMLSQYEGFGVPPIEAMAAGTPAIVSRFASLPEVVGDAGIVVDADQPDQVVAAIQQIDADPAYREGVIARGRARADYFRLSAVVDRLYNALQGARPK